MRMSSFVPAQDARHRAAALALYRALIRAANMVQLPNPTMPTRNPIVWLLRHQFAKNKSYSSSRLVYAGMAAGYKFLSVLAEAQDTSSSQYVRLVEHLKNSRVPKQWLTGAPPRRHLAPVHRTREGLIKRIANKDGTFHYVQARNLGSHEFHNLKRRSPSVCLTTEGIPFVRLRKPQPLYLGKQIGKKREQEMINMQRSLDAETGMMVSATREDTWEQIISQQSRKEGKNDSWQSDSGDMRRSYRWAPALQKLWYAWRHERTMLDSFARAKALQEISNGLYEKRDAMLETKEAPRGTSMSPIPRDSMASVKSSGEDGPLTRKVLDVTGELPTPATADPFSHPSWADIVNSSSTMMMQKIRKDAPLPST